MPRYFFDTDDGDLPEDDDRGLDFEDDESARKAGMAALADMARDRLPNGDRRTFEVRIRDEAGTALYTATMELSGVWHDGR